MAETTAPEVHELVEGRLRRSRQRYTHGRRALVDLLAAAGRPLTIPEILELDRELSQSSVYRNLQILEQVDAVRRVLTPSSESARYELAEDLTAHHHHLICSACGTITAFHPPPRGGRGAGPAARAAPGRARARPAPPPAPAAGPGRGPATRRTSR
jgi:Fur family transcriptional regulator, ferric uptake regulator